MPAPRSVTHRPRSGSSSSAANETLPGYDMDRFQGDYAALFRSFASYRFNIWKRPMHSRAQFLPARRESRARRQRAGWLDSVLVDGATRRRTRPFADHTTVFARPSAAASRCFRDILHLRRSPARSTGRRRGGSSADSARRSEILEFADEPDLRLEVHAALSLDGVLRDADQLANVLRGGVAQIHHDVRVDVRDLRVADAKSLEPALVDEPAGADAFDLLEDRAGARMPIEPRVLAAAPAQVLLQNALQHRLIGAREPERRGQHDVARW